MSDLTCRICMEDIKNPLMCKSCSAIHCKKCILKWLKRSKDCPNCRAALNIDQDLLKINWFNEQQNAQKPGNSKVDKKNNCPRHNRKVTMACVECKICICDLCIKADHSEHHVKVILEFYVEVLELLSTFWKILNNYCQDLHEMVDTYSSGEKALLFTQRIVVKEIDKLVQKQSLSEMIYSSSHFGVISHDEFVRIEYHLSKYNAEREATQECGVNMSLFAMRIKEVVEDDDPIETINKLKDYEEEFEKVEYEVAKKLNVVPVSQRYHNVHSSVYITDTSSYFKKKNEKNTFTCLNIKAFEDSFKFYVVFSATDICEGFIYIFGDSNGVYTGSNIQLLISTKTTKTPYKVFLKIGYAAVIKYSDLWKQLKLTKKDDDISIKIYGLDKCKSSPKLFSDMDLEFISRCKLMKDTKNPKNVLFEQNSYTIKSKSSIWKLRIVQRDGFIHGFISLLEGNPQVYLCKLNIPRKTRGKTVNHEARINAYFNCFDEKEFYQILPVSKIDGTSKISLEIELLHNTDLIYLLPKYKTGELAIENSETSCEFYDEHLYLWRFILRNTEYGYKLFAKQLMGTPGLYDFYYGYKTENKEDGRKLNGCTTKIMNIRATGQEYLLPLDKFNVKTTSTGIHSVFICIRAGNLAHKLSYPALF